MKVNNLEMPSAGGSYIREKDGSLTLVEAPEVESVEVEGDDGVAGPALLVEETKQPAKRAAKTALNPDLKEA